MPVLQILLTSAFFLLYCSPTFAINNSQSGTTLDSIEYFQIPRTAPLTLDSARATFNAGNALISSNNALSLGISDNITWVQLTVTNNGQHSLNRRLTVGKTWINHIDVYRLQSGRLVNHWQTGDDITPADDHLIPGVGYAINMVIPPGQHRILVSAWTHDPMILPFKLLSISAADKDDTLIQFSMALVYGIFVSMIALNLVLYVTLKQPYPLFYCVYIGCIICVNIAYNGYGFAWIYPESTLIQNYVILVFMVLYGISGIAFVVSYLDVKNHIPNLYRLLMGYGIIGMVIMTYYMSRFDHISATRFAFNYLTLATLLMIITGLLSLNKIKDAKYFLLSVICSMLGLLSTTLTVWGVLPYSYYAYNGVVLGVLCEAIILAIIIAIRLKNIESERIKHTYLSCYDPLTNLYNRRAFYQYGHPLVNSSFEDGAILSCVMMDLDHFKTLNDTYGHDIGDKVLLHTANVLTNNLRCNDIIARWGGEEIVVLLPKTTINEAYYLVERIRIKLQSTSIRTDKGMITVTASFGLSTLMRNDTLDHLLSRADQQLYIAKKTGRNRISQPDLILGLQ